MRDVLTVNELDITCDIETPGDGIVAMNLYVPEVNHLVCLAVDVDALCLLAIELTVVRISPHHCFLCYAQHTILDVPQQTEQVNKRKYKLPQ